MRISRTHKKIKTNKNTEPGRNKVRDFYYLPTLNQFDLKFLNRPTMIEEIKMVDNMISQNKNLVPDGLTGEFFQIFKVDILPIFFKIFQKIEETNTIE